MLLLKKKVLFVSSLKDYSQESAQLQDKETKLTYQMEKKKSPSKYSALVLTSIGGLSFGSFLGLLVSTFGGGFVFLFCAFCLV